MLSWGRLQSRHPPWEVRANRCASAVSMEMCQPGNRDEQPRLALEAFVFTESFLECKHGKQIFQLSRGTGLPSWPLGPWLTRILQSRAYVWGTLMSSLGTVGTGFG